MAEKFCLKPNMFVYFIYNFAPAYIAGSILLFLIKDFLYNDIFYSAAKSLLFFILLCFTIVKLNKNTGRYIVISDDSISIENYKNGNFEVTEYYSEEQIQIIDACDIYRSGKYKIINKNGMFCYIRISGFIKLKKELVLKINSELLKKFGNKTSFTDKYEIEEYIETGFIPKNILKDDKNIEDIQQVIAIFLLITSIQILVGTIA